MFTAIVKRREAQDKGGCLSVRMSVIVSTCFLSAFSQKRQGIEKVSCLPGYAVFVNNTKRHLLCFLYYFSVCKSFKELAFGRSRRFQSESECKDRHFLVTTQGF